MTSGDTPLPGVYTLTITAIDNAGNEVTETRQFVVFDPTGGFATGGGWINPDGDSTLPSTEEKASFGFVAKYSKKKGATGNLEFQYQLEGINLKSTTIDWVGINSTSAEFQGTGTLNGEGVYTFRVRVTDNGEPGTEDHFDIKIWEGTDTEADPVHRAKNTLAGGNIVIHKKSNKK